MNERQLVPPSVTQSRKFLPGQFAAIAFGKWEANVNLPSLPLQPLGRNQRVATVVTFPCINDARTCAREELLDRFR
jgi:hypothetical protein